MTIKAMSKFNLAIAVACLPLIASRADAQCCGVATTSYYQPVAYTAYSPVTYSAYRTGWYPGYFLDRIRARVFGAPSTYVAAYPTSYVASYPSAYVASYPTTHVASYPSYTASYSMSYGAAVACPTCVPSQQVTMRPIENVCCDPCASCCSSGASYGVSQTSFEQPACDCGQGQYGSQSSTVNSTGQPRLPEEADVPPRSMMKIPADNDGNAEVQESETGSGGGSVPGGQEGAGQADEVPGSGAQLQAPELFNPSGRTANRSIAPVRNALYTQPVGSRQVSNQSQRITAEQAMRDAAGWRSGSK